ncbi:hypothetical protein PG997_015201 [Apiospora hydei]|uniref:Uncharacterized protein n=1 Tax=Apiospora hydei TaxID=1337664 RepID=A0ABR1UVZ1_9PEZI
MQPVKKDEECLPKQVQPSQDEPAGSKADGKPESKQQDKRSQQRQAELKNTDKQSFPRQVLGPRGGGVRKPLRGGRGGGSQPNPSNTN